MRGINEVRVLFRKISEEAKTPEYSKRGDSGADLYSVEDFHIDPREIKLIGTGICIEINEGVEAQIRPKSGLASKGLSIVNSPGTVDSGYRGEIRVLLVNLGTKRLSFNKGDKIAQIVFAPVYRGHFIEMTELSDSDRGTGGFGSTGKF